MSIEPSQSRRYTLDAVSLRLSPSLAAAHLRKEERIA